MGISILCRAAAQTIDEDEDEEEGFDDEEPDVGSSGFSRFDDIPDQEVAFMNTPTGAWEILKLALLRALHPSYGSTGFVPEEKKYNDLLVAFQRSIIKEPMDFATMRAKLHEKMHRSLEKFEHDVHLICTNAMHFNASETTTRRCISEVRSPEKRKGVLS